jgi:hypothetical protein
MRKLFYIALAGFVFSAALIFLFGDSGLSAFGRLSDYRDRLKDNVGELVSLNGRLSAELDSLKRNPAVTEVLAGTLGLYGEKDRVILLKDAASGRVSYDAGKLLRLAKRKETMSVTFKIVGIAAVIFLALVLFILRGFARKRPGHDYRRG